jgi:hypothetical protein
MMWPRPSVSRWGQKKRVDVRTRLMDVELSVVKRLGELPYPAYLCAMCVIATEIREAYFPFSSENGRALSLKTIDAVSSAVSDEGGDGGFELFGEWEQLIADPAEDGPSGWFAAAFTFRDLAGELARERAPRTALTWLTNTAVDLPEDRPAERSGPRLVKIDFNKEADEDSPQLRMLRKFEWIAGFAAELARQELPCGPDTILSAAPGHLSPKAEVGSESQGDLLGPSS